MAVGTGRDPERSFGDALAGSGGTADPTYPSSLSGDVFPDALAAAPLGGMPLSRSQGPVTPAPVAASGPIGSAALARTVPPRGPVPRPARNAGSGRTAMPPPNPMPPGYAVPPRNAVPPNTIQAPGQRPWSRVPSGAPAQQYVPVPTSAQLAPGGPSRPPAYLPQRPGLAQARAAVAQARSTSARRSGAARSSARKNSGAWGFVIFVFVLLVTSGAGQKILSLVSELFQRK